MRYREGIPPDQLSTNFTDDMLLFTVVLAFVIGCVLTWLGSRGRQRWLVFWSVGLVLVSSSYASYLFFYQGV